MGSALNEILDAIEAWEPKYDSDSTDKIGVWNIDDQKDELSPMECPKRVFVVPESAADPIAFIALGNTIQIEWTFTDRLFIAPVGEMASLRRYGGPILRYAKSYAEAAQADRGLGSNVTQAHVVNVVVTPGVFDWPVGSGNDFFGANVEVTIQEVF